MKNTLRGDSAVRGWRTGGNVSISGGLSRVDEEGGVFSSARVAQGPLSVVG